jgi:ribosomal protein S18 acetylase RimI-like enzyme
MQPTPGSHRVSRLHPDQITQASDVLARAFHQDPLQSYVFPDPKERAALSPAHFEPLIRYGLMAGEVWATTDPLNGVAVWWPPAHTDIDTMKLTEAGFLALLDTIGTEAFRRFSAFLDYIEPFHRADMPDPHWYAMVIGVDSHAQGRGIGSLLMSPVLSRADEDGSPCYLETCQPANSHFYQKHGFQVIRSGTEPGSELAYWTFIRPPERASLR